MDGFFGSELSSSGGCESGWTLYLEHSHSLKTDDNMCKKDSFTHVTEEEEDMSMVSDASSGPQHFPDDECFKLSNNGGTAYTNGKMKKVPKIKIHDLPSFLDDTASSPFFNNNITVPSKVENEIIDYSQGYSTTYLKGESAFEDHFGYQNQWLQGKRWG